MEEQSSEPTPSASERVEAEGATQPISIPPEPESEPIAATTRPAPRPIEPLRRPVLKRSRAPVDYYVLWDEWAFRAGFFVLGAAGGYVVGRLLT